MALFHTTVLDNQIKALPTVDTATGSIATFNTDLTENLVEVKCQIVAKQASGTPSPVNPLPIQTYTEMNVGLNGVNFFDGANASKIGYGGNNYWINVGDSRMELGSSSNATVMLPCKPNKTYTISLTDSAVFRVGYGIMKDLSDHLTQYDLYSVSQNTGDGRKSITITTGANATYLFIQVSNATFDTIKTTIQVELGNEMTSFVAYNGTTANIPFGQTVANGVLDINSGKLRVTGVDVDMGSLSWTYDSTYSRFYAVSLPQAIYGTVRTIPFLCEIYEPVSDGRPMSQITNNQAYFGVGGGGQMTLYVHDNRYTDATSFQSAVNGYYVCYSLDVPIEIQLDSITLQALLNENNIWCDTGDTEVKYLLSVGEHLSQS